MLRCTALERLDHFAGDIADKKLSHVECYHVIA
jgi:hypothetical protein